MAATRLGYRAAAAVRKAAHGQWSGLVFADRRMSDKHRIDHGARPQLRPMWYFGNQIRFAMR
jgi:hypothetical protein